MVSNLYSTTALALRSLILTGTSPWEILRNLRGEGQFISAYQSLISQTYVQVAHAVKMNSSTCIKTNWRTMIFWIPSLFIFELYMLELKASLRLDKELILNSNHNFALKLETFIKAMAVLPLYYCCTTFESKVKPRMTMPKQSKTKHLL